MTHSSATTLGVGVRQAAITANVGTTTTFSRSTTVGASRIRVPANRRVTLQTRISNQTQNFSTRIQEQRQGLFQAGQWTNHGNSVTRSSSATQRVPGFRAIETAVGTAASR